MQSGSRNGQSTMSFRGATADAEESSSFYLMITGQVESGDFYGADNLYCKYSFSYGHDWTVVTGLDGVTAGLSQIAKKGSAGMDNTFGGSVVWNFPIDVAFKSTNAFGWPRVSFTVYGIDALGRDKTYGYGSMLVPTQPGHYVKEIEMYAPMPSSWYQRILNSITGTYPEFFDTKFVAQGSNREVTRVESTGSVRVQVQIATKDMQKFGYVPASSGENPLNFSTHTMNAGAMGSGGNLASSTRTMDTDLFIS
mmetsp:Transcript_5126/g.8624  ORF Transcript_5126/g.8624 Transcript_5126/m.8624 type:complete len:252 (+) Transcript_5126:45-800(+)